MVADIHSIDHPVRAGDGPTETEAGLAHQLGKLQGQVRNRATRANGSDVDSGEPPAEVAAVLATSLADTTDLIGRLSTVQTQDDSTDERQHAADEAADLAASAVTAVLESVSLPLGLDHVEVVGLVRAYLQGLAESPIGDVFRSWLRRATGTPAPDPAATLLEPDARMLEVEADLEYLQARLDAKAGGSITADTRVGQEQKQDPLLAAVDLANQARFLRTGTGVCAGCSRPGDLLHRNEAPGHEVRPHEIVR
jgi:hypothetical protein